MAYSDNVKVFLIAQTEVCEADLTFACSHIDHVGGVEGGATKWLHELDDTLTGADKLIEFCGRLCYKSFGTELNANLTHTRNDSKVYLGNILSSHHGSVTEHAYATFLFAGLSRVGTHELVRHRAGTGFAQESMRFVRVENVRFYYPDALKTGNEEQDFEIFEAFKATFEVAEREYKRLANLLLSDPEMPFRKKKKITSAMRRILPDGILTDIVMTANHRSWRHIIAVRTSEHAEEEIHYAMCKVARRLQSVFPNIYQDMHVVDNAYVFEHDKI